MNTNQRLSALHIKVAQLYDQIEGVEADIRTLKEMEAIHPKTGGRPKGAKNKVKKVAAPTPAPTPVAPKKTRKARGKSPAPSDPATGDSGISPEDQARVDKALNQTFKD